MHMHLTARNVQKSNGGMIGRLQPTQVAFLTTRPEFPRRRMRSFADCLPVPRVHGRAYGRESGFRPLFSNSVGNRHLQSGHDTR